MTVTSSGQKVPEKTNDTYLPRVVDDVKYLLKSLERAVNKCCYISKQARIADVISKRFVTRGLPIQVRWLHMISMR